MSFNRNPQEKVGRLHKFELSNGQWGEPKTVDVDYEENKVDTLLSVFMLEGEKVLVSGWYRLTLFDITLD